MTQGENMKKLCIVILTVLGAPCFASHHTLNLQEKIEYARKRIALLKSQRDAQKLLKKDTHQLEADITLEERSLEALQAQHRS